MGGECRVTTIFKQMLKASSNFSDYNFRTYFVRRVNQHMKKYESIQSAEEKDKFIDESEKMLAMLERQSTLSQTFKASKLPIE